MLRTKSIIDSVFQVDAQRQTPRFSSLSLWERAGVRVAFAVRVGLDVGNAFSRMLSGDDHVRETPWPITIANC
jgi:hypothetical protein